MYVGSTWPDFSKEDKVCGSCHSKIRKHGRKLGVNQQMQSGSSNQDEESGLSESAAASASSSTPKSSLESSFETASEESALEPSSNPLTEECMEVDNNGSGSDFNATVSMD